MHNCRWQLDLVVSVSNSFLVIKKAKSEKKERAGLKDPRA